MPRFLKPEINKANKAFWDGLKEEKFLLQKCNACGEIFFPPRLLCPECLSEDISHVESKGTGTLYAFTEIRARTPGFKTPFVLGLIELDEKPGRFLSQILAPYDTLKIGMRVKVKYQHEKNFSVHTFVPE
ncbi:MAG: Zn-ribbon domain-containing OB-fold protein [Promethearchaeia archaeon]